jgi:YesN/AraC family two-component response regulator
MKTTAAVIESYIPDPWLLIQEKLHDLEHNYTVYINFHDIMGISSLHQESQHVMAPYLYHNNPFCNEVKSNPTQFTKCIASKSKVLSKAEKDSKPFFGHCYMGFYEYVFPVTIKNTLIGVLCIGNLEGVLEHEIQFFKYCYTLIALIKNVYYDYLQFLESSSSMMVDPSTLKQQHMISLTLQFIADNHNKPLSLEMLAQNVYVHPTYLSSQFKENMGIGIANYIKKLRLQHSEYYLRNTSMTITEVALEVGISDPAYYSRIFKETYGINPREFRKKHNL